jgi:hypothetical protein
MFIVVDMSVDFYSIAFTIMRYMSTYTSAYVEVRKCSGYYRSCLCYESLLMLSHYCGVDPPDPPPPPPLSVNITVHEYLSEKERLQTGKQAVYSQAACVAVSANIS